MKNTVALWGTLLLLTFFNSAAFAEVKTGLEWFSLAYSDIKISLGCEHPKTRNKRFYLLFDTNKEDLVPYSHICSDRIGDDSLRAWNCGTARVTASKIDAERQSSLPLNRQTLIDDFGNVCSVSPNASRVADFVQAQKEKIVSKNKI